MDSEALSPARCVQVAHWLLCPEENVPSGLTDLVATYLTHQYVHCVCECVCVHRTPCLGAGVWLMARPTGIWNSPLLQVIVRTHPSFTHVRKV